MAKLDDIALRDYKSVKYYPFGNSAASPFILTSDPLSYLEASINSQYAEIKRDRKKFRQNLLKAKYFTRLAKDFYLSSNNAKMPSKGTMLYYSFINLVKVYLILCGKELETKTEHHGLSLPATSKTTLRISNIGNGDGISIFHEFAKFIGKPINQVLGPDIKFVNLLRNLPEVHEIGYALNLFPNTKRKFLPVDVKIRTNSKRNQIYYTIAYNKKFDKQMRVDRLKKAVYAEKLVSLEVDDGGNYNYFRSKLNINYTNSSNKSWIMCYKKLVTDINLLNLTPMLTRDGYKYYIDLEPHRLHRLSSLLAFAYYIGTVARYRPSLNEEILKGKFQAIINEAIIACPSQFFYLLVSQITHQICAIPKSNIL